MSKVSNTKTDDLKKLEQDADEEFGAWLEDYGTKYEDALRTELKKEDHHAVLGRHGHKPPVSR
jgi:hypothetical protein